MASISDDEFCRLQEQLLELKTSNYALEEKTRRLETDLSSAISRKEQLELDLQKAQQMAKLNPLALAKNMSDQRRETKDNKREIIALQSEKEILERKIESQEEEFRRANRLLRQEIQLLTDVNHQMQDELSFLKNALHEASESKCEHETDGPRETVTLFIGSKSALDNGSTEDTATEPACDKSAFTESSPSSSTSTPKKSSLKNSIDPTETRISYSLMAEKEFLENKVRDLEAEMTRLKEESESRLTHLDNDKDRYQSTINEMQVKCNQLEELKVSHSALSQVSNTQLETIAKLEQQISELRTEIETDNQKNQDKIIDISQEFQVKLNEAKDEIAQLKQVVVQMDLLRQRISALETERDEGLEQIARKGLDLADSLVNHEQEIIHLKDQFQRERDEMNGRKLLVEEECEMLKEDLKRETTKYEDLLEDRKIHERKGVTLVKELKKQLANEKKRADKLQEKLEETSTHDTGYIHGHVRKPSNSSNMNGGDNSSVSSWSLMSSGRLGHTNSNVGTSAQSSHSGDSDIATGPVVRSPSHNVPDSCASSISGGTTLHLNDHNGKQQHDDIGSDPDFSDDNERALLMRTIKTLQDDKVVLQEKLSHLESNMSSMADDILRKNQLISHYCMGSSGPSVASHSDSSPAINANGVPHSLSASSFIPKHLLSSDQNSGLGSVSGSKFKKKLSDLLSPEKMLHSDESNLRDTIRRLQNMLEETLTKNMHLQSNLELLSHENEDLKSS